MKREQRKVKDFKKAAIKKKMRDFFALAKDEQ